MRFSDQLCPSLALETHLQELRVSFTPALIDVLPRCSSLRSLDLFVPFGVDITLLSEFLLQTPSIQSLSLYRGTPIDLSSLSVSTLKSFEISHSTLESVSETLTRSNGKSLTNLDLSELSGSYEPLATALLECPSLINLTISHRHSTVEDLLPVVQVLHRLPLLTTLTVDLRRFSDESVECLVSFLSQAAVQDLKLGTLSPKQLQLFADALPSISSLQSLQFDTRQSDSFQHESSYLALFSALPSSSLRSLTCLCCSLRRAAFETCLNEIPASRLTNLQLKSALVYEGSDLVDIDSINWSNRFPQIKDRFCLLVSSW
jgi:hypothetical protein